MLRNLPRDRFIPKSCHCLARGGADLLSWPAWQRYREPIGDRIFELLPTTGTLLAVLSDNSDHHSLRVSRACS